MEKLDPPIDNFSGQFEFLSNFSDSPVKYEGIEYPTVEHAYQAAKSLDMEDRVHISECPTPGAAKKAGRKVKLRADWESVKDGVMLELLRQKFTDPDLKYQLLETRNAPLIEGNWWGDTYWGVCKGVGKNMLGQLLMQVRQELRNE